MIQAPQPDERKPARQAGYRIASFIRSFTKVVLVAMGMAVTGLGMKYAAVPAGDYVFVFAMAVLVLLFLVQIGLSFFYVIANVRLALLGSICSVALVLGFTALIFRYQGWFGWQLTFYIALPIFLVTAYFLIKHFRKRETLQPQHCTFLYQNLMVPYLFIVILAVLSAVSGAYLTNQSRLQSSPVYHQESADTTDLWRSY